MTNAINYDKLPKHCQEGMRSYIEDGILPGSFLAAVISNKLMESFMKADDTNLRSMFYYVDFLYNEMPIHMKGEENMHKYIEEKAKERTSE